MQTKASLGLLMIIVMILIGSFKMASAQTPVDFDMAKWHDSFCYGEEVCLVGQFNGIGGDDIVAFTRSSKTGAGAGDVWVALAAGDHFEGERLWNDSFCYGEEVCAVGDFDGDGRDDIIAFVRSSNGNDSDGDVWVALSDGQSFVNPEVWHDSFCYSLEACLIGDFNGDGKDDIAAATGPARDGNQADDVWVALSNGSAFVDARVWGKVTGCTLLDDNYSCMAGNIDGDKDDDIVSFERGTDRLWGIASNGKSFDQEERWMSKPKGASGEYVLMCNLRGQSCQMADYDADGRDDIFTFTYGTDTDHPEGIFINYSWGIPANSNPEFESGYSYGALLAADAFCTKGTICRVGDFNNDGQADVVIFYRSLYPNDSLDGDVWVAINYRRR